MFKQVQGAYSELEHEAAGNAQRTGHQSERTNPAGDQHRRHRESRTRNRRSNEPPRETDEERRARKAAWDKARKTEAEQFEKDAQDWNWTRPRAAALRHLGRGEQRPRATQRAERNTTGWTPRRRRRRRIPLLVDRSSSNACSIAAATRLTAGGTEHSLDEAAASLPPGTAPG